MNEESLLEWSCFLKHAPKGFLLFYTIITSVKNRTYRLEGFKPSKRCNYLKNNYLKYLRIFQK
ncbi:MAG: hypothetical protein RL329_3889 [Bacteroidota bacterium]|jgi:hypothetical protein